MRDAQLSLADIKLILRLLSRSAFGLEREGMQRVRAILAGARGQMAVADEILAALEDRVGRYNPPPPPGSGARGRVDGIRAFRVWVNGPRDGSKTEPR